MCSGSHGDEEDEIYHDSGGDGDDGVDDYDDGG